MTTTGCPPCGLGQLVRLTDDYYAWLGDPPGCRFERMGPSDLPIVPGLYAAMAATKIPPRGDWQYFIEDWLKEHPQ